MTRLYMFFCLFVINFCVLPQCPAAQLFQQTGTGATIGEALGRSIHDAERLEQQLLKDIEAKKRDIEAVRREIRETGKGTTSGPYALARFSPAIMAALLACCFWAAGLKILSKEIGEQYCCWLNNALLQKTLVLFIALGLVLAVCNLANAGSGTAFEKQDLLEALRAVRSLPSSGPEQRVLAALEEPGCTRVDIPQSVMNMISASCNDSNLILNPILGSGYHRIAAVAAISWAVGDRDKALSLLAPAITQDFPDKNPEVLSFLMTALSLYAAKLDTAAVPRIAQHFMDGNEVEALAWTANKTKLCCRSIAVACLAKASSLAGTPDAVVLVAVTLRDFAGPGDIRRLFADNLRLTADIGVMRNFLRIARELRSDAEQSILEYNMELRDTPQSLLELAQALNDLGYRESARRALTKAADRESNGRVLVVIAEAAIAWNHLELAKKALDKCIAVEGPAGGEIPVRDPLLLPAGRMKPTRQDPSVGILLGIISEKLGDEAAAEAYYSEYLRRELTACSVCRPPRSAVNFTNFYYPYRYYLSRGRKDVLEVLEPFGRDLEKSYIARLTETTRVQLEKQLKAHASELETLREDLAHVKRQNAINVMAFSCLTLFYSIFFALFIISQYVAAAMTLGWVRRFEKFKMLAGFLRMAELEGFILLPSLILAPAGLLLVLGSQMLQAALLPKAQAVAKPEVRRPQQTQN